MKSILRINGVEVVVENVPPASVEFNIALGKEIEKMFGECEKVDAQPVLKLGQREEGFESVVSSILWGHQPGIIAMSFTLKTKEAANDIVIPGFVEFAL